MLAAAIAQRMAKEKAPWPHSQDARIDGGPSSFCPAHGTAHTDTQPASQRSVARASAWLGSRGRKYPAQQAHYQVLPGPMQPISKNLARVLGASDFTNAIAAWTVLISEGNFCAGPAGVFFSLIVLNGPSATVGYPRD